MSNLMIINENLYRLTLPYKDIFTTVYLFKTNDGAMLFDTATTVEDVENFIIPFINEANVFKEDLKYIFISHNHRDHAGGINRLIEEFPHAYIISRSDALKENYTDFKFVFPNDGDIYFDCLHTVVIPGHTQDSCAVLDTRTNTLVTGDCLQLYGIYGSGDWGCNISFYEEHLKALEKLKTLDINTIYTAHDYHPLGYNYTGKDEILKAIDYCIEPLEKIINIIKDNINEDDEKIRELYNSSENVPTVNLRVVSSLRKYLNNR